MKKILLISTLALTCSIMAWGATITVGEGGSYSLLADAISNAEEGDIIELTSNVSLPAAKCTINKSVTIDFKTFTVSFSYPIAVASNTSVTFDGTTGGLTGSNYIDVSGNLVIEGGLYTTSMSKTVCPNTGCDLVVNGGSITNSHVSGTAIDMSWGGSVTINGGTLYGYTQAISCVSKNDAVVIINGGSITGNQYGIAFSKGHMTINGGSISGPQGIHIVANGMLPVMAAYAYLTINGGSISGATHGIWVEEGPQNYATAEVTIHGGTILASTGCGIYYKYRGTLNIDGNPLIMGETGIQLRGGSNMKGSISSGRVEAVLDGTPSFELQGTEVLNNGAALSIVESNNYTGTPAFTIDGGMFLSKQEYVFKAYQWTGGADGSRSERATLDGYFDVSKAILSSDVKNDFDGNENTYVELTDNKTLDEDQQAKYVAIEENKTLTINEDKTLHVGEGGLNLESGAQVVVEPGAVVTVNGVATANGADNIVLKSSAEKQAILLVDPTTESSQPMGTIKLHTTSKQKSGAPSYKYSWEYFAIPVASISADNKPTNNYDEAVHGLFAGNASFATGVYSWEGNNWSPVTSWTSLIPFKGYQLTNNSANGGVEYAFKGILLGNGDGTYDFVSEGYGYFGNSYTAPIVISNFLNTLDGDQFEKTVWVFDENANQYVQVNMVEAPVSEIRSLQAFILKKTAEGAGSAALDYSDAIWDNPRINSLAPSASSAPARLSNQSEFTKTRIHIASNGNKETLTLVEGAAFSDAFDNGADASKYINNSSMNLYAETNDGKLGIVAKDNLENTLLTFQAGATTEYTLSFEFTNNDYLLRDNVTGQTVAMKEDTEYTFTQAANTTAQARFEVVAIAKMPTAIENVEETAKKEGIFTITGQYMGRDFTKLPAGVYVVNGVKIVK